MKKICMYFLLLSVAFISACSTNVGVESAQHPVAKYSSSSGDFDAKMNGDISSVFKIANRVLDDLKYFRVGEKVKDTYAITVARALLDEKIEIKITNSEKVGVVNVSINYDDGNLMKSQEIFNMMSKMSRNSSM